MAGFDVLIALDFEATCDDDDLYVSFPPLATLRMHLERWLTGSSRLVLSYLFAAWLTLVGHCPCCHLTNAVTPERQVRQGRPRNDGAP